MWPEPVPVPEAAEANSASEPLVSGVMLGSEPPKTLATPWQVPVQAPVPALRRTPVQAPVQTLHQVTSGSSPEVHASSGPKDPYSPVPPVSKSLRPDHLPKKPPLPGPRPGPIILAINPACLDNTRAVPP